MNERTRTFLQRVADNFGEDCDTSQVNFIDTRIKVHFICPKHGGFDVRPDVLLGRKKNNKRRRICPKCSLEVKQQELISVSLAELRPDISEHWDYKKNTYFTPHTVAAYSNKIFWFSCPKHASHSWQSTLNNLVNSDSLNCPFCKGLKVNHTNSLAALFPHLAAQWHPQKNKEIKPSEVYAFKTKTKFSWKCNLANDHEWTATVISRTRGNESCPFCEGKKLSVSNSLATVYPKIANEFHPILNGKKTAKNFRCNDAEKIWWRCLSDSSHEWQAGIYARTVMGNNCPFCSGRRPTEEDNFQVLHPDLAKEWHPELNGTLKPSEIKSSSGQKIWWQCVANPEHVYDALPQKRVRGDGCPYCGGKRVDKFNNLATTFPKIAAEWHPTKNGRLVPTDFTSGSSQKIWWQCVRIKSHQWKAVIFSRSRGSGCPYCTSQTSLPEIRLFTELQFAFENVKSRGKVNGKEADVFLPDISIAIEYDGVYFHGGSVAIERDKNKNTHFLKNGVQLLRVREEPLPKIESTDIIVKKTGLRKKDLDQIVELISSLCPQLKSHSERYASFENFQNDDVYRELVSCLPDPFPEDSLEQVAPLIAQEWDFKKNYPLTPRNFSVSSGQKFWWICKRKPKHSWKTTIASRTSSGSDCPYCSNRLVSEENNLEAVAPNLVNQFHPEKNKTLEPTKVIAGSAKRIWWRCDKGPDHEWKAAPSTRLKGVGCPFCANQKVSITNSLETANPEFLKEWHPTKNLPLTPSQVIAGSSSNKIWWKCPKGPDHEWVASPSSRNRSGCPFCSGQKVSVTNNLSATRPEIAKLWHPTLNESLKPEDLVGFSRKKIWWQCLKEKSHVWQDSPSSVRACGFCSGHRVNFSNSIAGLFPELASQWHPLKNGDVRPEEVYGRSHKKFWWQCPVSSDHEWSATPENRAASRGCPFCGGKRASVTNSLTSLFPEIAREWHTSKNGDLTPDQISAGSHKKVWFICKVDPTHEWRTTLKNRTWKKSPTGCPICYGRKPKDYNS